MGFIGQGFNFGEFVPASGYPSGAPTAWWDANEITGLNDGEKVTQWNDELGTYHLTHSNATYQPIYKTNIQNGMPVVRFNDSANNKLYNAAIEMAYFSTIFLVINFRTWTLNTRWFDSYPTPNFYLAVQAATTPNWTLYRGTQWELNALALATWAVVTIQWKASGQQTVVRVNGSQVGTGSTAGLGSEADGFTIGGSGNSDTNGSEIDVAEMIIYDGTEDPEVNEAALIAKWGIS